MQAIAVNLSIVQRSGDPHALCFLDQARYLRHHLGRLGIDCLLSKNRLYRDRLNVVFGAHKGFDPKLTQDFPCVIFNLEQTGRDGANLTEAYLDLLRALPSLDYDAANQSHYASTQQGPIVRFLDAPYLRGATPAPPLSQRPIDLLFFGSINERRRRLIEQIEAAGCAVTMFDQALYGPERDAIIVQAKAVLNLHFYESGRIEQARISHCLSLGTPVISERKLTAEVPVEFEDTVFWQPADSIAQFIRGCLTSPQFPSEAEAKIRRFHANDPLDSLRPLAAFLERQWHAIIARRRDSPAAVASPRRMNLGCGNDYLPGWINVDTRERFHPDVVLDLSNPIPLPLALRSPTLGDVVLDCGGLEAIYARGEFVRAADFAALMTNALELLEKGGILAIEVPYPLAGSGWQDPGQVRVLDEESFSQFTDSFWNMGWFAHRFAIARLEYLDPKMAPCPREAAAFLRILLRKVATTVHERMRARVFGADFGPGLEGEVVTAAAIARAARLQEPA